MISGALVFSRWFSPPILGLAVGVLLGGLFQLLLQLPALRARKVRIRPCFALNDPAVGRITRLFLPAAFGAAVYQLNIFVSNLLASFLPEGSISYLWYASRLLEFPLGVFGVALATAAFPRMSRESSRNQMPQFRDVLDRTLGMVAFICLPAMVGLILLRTPIIEVLFQRGAFDPVTTQRTAQALFYYCLGLWPIAAGRILVTAFYSLQDTATPVKISFVAFIGNVILSLLLMGPMLHAGLALANSLSALLNLCLLLFLFRKKAGACGFSWVRKTGGKVLVACALMGGFVLWMMHLFRPLVEAGPWGILALLAGCVCGGGIVYLGACHVMGVGELREFVALVTRRRRG
jgi:putative peptidoglycan lipid II flippase